MPARDVLIDYLDFIERMGYEVTINDFSGLIVSDETESARFAAYFIHRNPFCMFVKSNAQLWNECLRRKSGLCAAAARRPEGFRGLCFCGREEYIVPVMRDGIVLATIGLGGFSTDRASSLGRAARHCEETESGTSSSAGARIGAEAGMEARTGESGAASAGKSLASRFDLAARRPAPDPADARALLGMAASAVGCLYESLEAAKGRLMVPEAARLSRERRLVLHAAEYLRQHATESVGARQVARACHISVSTLSHIFKSTMGRSLRAYLLGLRLDLAKKKLKEGHSVTDAALSSGFEDPNYFSRAFSRAEGLPPGRWAGKRHEPA